MWRPSTNIRRCLVRNWENRFGGSSSVESLKFILKKRTSEPAEPVQHLRSLCKDSERPISRGGSHRFPPPPPWQHRGGRGAWAGAILGSNNLQVLGSFVFEWRKRERLTRLSGGCGQKGGVRGSLRGHRASCRGVSVGNVPSRLRAPQEPVGTGVFPIWFKSRGSPHKHSLCYQTEVDHNPVFQPNFYKQ